jgi:hypothetical protein
MEQRMGLPLNHMAGPFQSVAVEVVGPIEYQGKRAGKGWGVVFVCTTTSAAHIEFAATCSSTDSFLMALRRFMCFKGTPSRFQSDRSEQLVEAAKQASLWDFKEVIQPETLIGGSVYQQPGTRVDKILSQQGGFPSK